jgi:hypothetical protein
MKMIKEIIKNIQGRGREENKKVEGTSFGYPKNGLLDYPIFYLERLFVKIIIKFLILFFFRNLFKLKIK